LQKGHDTSPSNINPALSRAVEGAGPMIPRQPAKRCFTLFWCGANACLKGVSLEGAIKAGCSFYAILLHHLTSLRYRGGFFYALLKANHGDK